MKKIFYDWAAVMLLSIVFVSCSDYEEDAGGTLSISSFYPTIVMEGTEVTITGTALEQVTEVIFPGGQSAVSLEVVDTRTLKAKVPSNVSEQGEAIVVRTADAEVSSRQRMRKAKPGLNYFTPSETVETYSNLSIIGNDLLLTDKVIFESEEESLTIEALDFIRKSNTEVKVYLPESTPLGEDIKVSLVFKNGEVMDLGTLTIIAGEGGGSWVEKEMVLYEGEPVVIGNWENSVIIPKDKFATAKVGDVIRVYITDQTGDWQQGALKEAAGGWPGLNDELGSFDISGDFAQGYYERAIDEEILGKLLANDMAIQGCNYTLTKVSLFTSVWVEESGDSNTDPITPETIMLNDFEDSGDHNASWDGSWTDAEATEFLTDEKGNVYLHLAKTLDNKDGSWVINCNHQDKGTVSGIENYCIKFDIKIEEGTVGASQAAMQFVLADKWLWVGAGMFPESTDGKWITVSYKIADLASDLTGDYTLGMNTTGIYGGSTDAPVPAGICLDNLRLDPIK